MKKSFFSNIYVKHFLASFGVLLLLLLGIGQLLKNITDHGESVKVPDFKGLKTTALENFIKDKPFRFVITDSVYDLKKPKGTVVEQTPAPGFNVKTNRTIYLTVNATQPPQVKMPNLIDASLRQAISLLETYGLKVGNLNYKPDIAKNAVLEQFYAGKKINPGSSVIKGSSIDLTLGKGISDEKVEIPSLISMKRNEALNIINLASLTVGAEVFDKDVKDSSLAKVYRQHPAPSKVNLINMGSPVNLFYTQDESKIKTVSDSVQIEEE